MRIALPFFALLTLLLVGGHWLTQQEDGHNLTFSLMAGTLLGVVLQRTRFCFLCHSRDWVNHGDSRGLLAILLALAVGSVIYLVILGGWLPNPVAGRLPPDIHIGPVSWVLVLAGLAFGVGMVISGSCISAHLYRLGEGSATAPFALIGTALGFAAGFASWNFFYSLAIADAPLIWLPTYLGYAASYGLQLAVLASIALLLWRHARSCPLEPQANPATIRALVASWFRGRWPYWLGGLGVGLIAGLMILRTKPLGVTAAIGSSVRELISPWGWLPQRLDGLDQFAGCATLPASSWLSHNLLLITGLVGGSLAAAIASRQFTPRWPRLTEIGRGLVGGLLLGWGAMIGLGCTIGTLLSGTMAGALSGWVFAAATFTAVLTGLRVERRLTVGKR